MYAVYTVKRKHIHPIFIIKEIKTSSGLYIG